MGNTPHFDPFIIRINIIMKEMPQFSMTMRSIEWNNHLKVAVLMPCVVTLDNCPWKGHITEANRSSRLPTPFVVGIIPPVMHQILINFDHSLDVTMMIAAEV